MSETNIIPRIQDPLLFTGQVRSKDGEKLLGTAFVVDRQRQWLVTCKHVLADAKVSPARWTQPGCVQICFPHVSRDLLYPAHVEYYFDDIDCSDDIIILEIESPLSSEIETAVLGSTADRKSDDNEFRSFGFRNPDGWLAEGKILGIVPHMPGNWCADRIQMSSQNIRFGMSGSPILDKKRNLVVAMVTNRWNSGGDSADRDTCFALDCAILERWGITIHEGYRLPYRETPAPTISTIVKGTIETHHYAFPHPPEFHDAPLLDDAEWVIREDLLAVLTDDYRREDVSLVGLIGFAGQGKSSLARQWVDTLLEQEQPDGFFWWNFYADQNFNNFLEKALVYLGGTALLDELVNKPNLNPIGGQAKKQEPINSIYAVEALGYLIQKYRLVFILDGLEQLQSNDGENYGKFPVESSALKRLLGFFVATGHQSFCLVTSRCPLFDFSSNLTYRQHNVAGFSHYQARNLLLKLGVRGDSKHVADLIQKWDGYPLVLKLLADKIRHNHHGNLDAAMADDDFPLPLDEEARMDRIKRALTYYDRFLSLREKLFLTVFSAFRHPVPDTAFQFAFQANNALIGETFAAPEAIDQVVTALMGRSVLRRNDQGEYSAHRLMTEYYFEVLSGADAPILARIRENIIDYYMSLIEVNSRAGLDINKPLIEVIYHDNSQGHRSDLTSGQKVRLEEVLSQRDPNTLSHRWLARGRYLLIKKLDIGGQAEVHSAYDVIIQQPVAVKILRHHENENEDDHENSIRRFTQEAKVVNQFNHRHIIRFYESQIQRDTSEIYIVMPLLRGGSLQQRLGGDLSLEFIVDVLKKVASALDYAHNLSVLHRDIKPSNIMFDDNDEPYVIDFGLAKRLSRTTPGLTATGAMIGTYDYMPPEQWQEESSKLTGAVDQYALGIIAYQLLTGRHPFPASNRNDPVSWLNRHFLEHPQPLVELDKDVREKVRPIIERVLAKKPEERYPTVTAFATAFAEAIIPPVPDISDQETSDVVEVDIPEVEILETWGIDAPEPDGIELSVSEDIDIASPEPVQNIPVPWLLGVGLTVAIFIFAVVVLSRSDDTNVTDSTATAVAIAANGSHTAEQETLAAIVFQTETQTALILAVAPTEETPTAAQTPSHTYTVTPDITPSLTSDIIGTEAALLTVTAAIAQALSAVVPPSPTATATVTEAITETATTTATATQAATEAATATMPPPTLTALFTPEPCLWYEDQRKFPASETGFLLDMRPPMDVMHVADCLKRENEVLQFVGLPFIISLSPITNEQYRLCMVANRCSLTNNDAVHTQDGIPVVGVTWSQADIYCTELDGRLPTEIEWHYASRGILSMASGNPIGEWLADGPDDNRKTIISSGGIRWEEKIRASNNVGFRCVFDIPQ